LSRQLSKDELAFIYPRKPKGMSRRNLLVKQLAEFAAVLDNAKTVDLANLTTLGNAPMTDLPAVTVATDQSNLLVSWEDVTYYRDQHPDDYPVIVVANITQRLLFIVGSSVTLGASGRQSFSVDGKPYGLPSDDYSGFMLATGPARGRSSVGFGTIGVTRRPTRPPKKG